MFDLGHRLHGAPLEAPPIYAFDLAEADACRDLAIRSRSDGPILVGLDRAGALPSVNASTFDVLLTTAERPPAPWVNLESSRFDDAVAALHGAVARNPIAARLGVMALRLTEDLPFDRALIVESLTYSTLLAGDEFRRWLNARPCRISNADHSGAMVRTERMGDTLYIELTRPSRRNAFSARMRDELFEALLLLKADDGLIRAELRAQGPDFCAGGDLNEFGLCSDMANAHAIRLARSVAALAYEERGRLSIRVHGASIGAGIEIAAAASSLTAAPDAWFKLPELSMGLVPGAGGLCTLPRRIGRARTCYMFLTGERIDADTALSWGLIDGIEDSQ